MKMRSGLFVFERMFFCVQGFCLEFYQLMLFWVVFCVSVLKGFVEVGLLGVYCFYDVSQFFVQKVWLVNFLSICYNFVEKECVL